MIIKLQHNGVCKKISARDSTKSVSELTAIAAKFANTDPKAVTLSFIDSENEKMYLADELDLEYFFDQLNKNKSLGLNVEVQSTASSTVSDIKKEVEEFKNIEEPSVVTEESKVIEQKKESTTAPVTTEFKTEPTTTEKKPQADIEKLEKNLSHLKDSIFKAVHPVFERLVDKHKRRCTLQTCRACSKSKDKKTTEAKAPEQSKPAEEAKPVQDVKPVEIVQSEIIQPAKEEKPAVETKSEVNKPAEQKKRCCQRKVANEKTHFSIFCDGCGVGPIEGVRFKCLVCPNFDLCAKCEANGHDHAMLRLPNRENQIADPIRHFYQQNSERVENKGRTHGRFKERKFQDIPFLDIFESFLRKGRN